MYLFGHMPDLDDHFGGLTGWVNGDSGRRPFAADEITYFDQVFAVTAPDYCRTVAWWSLAGDIMWSLDRDVAEKIAAAVRAKGEQRRGRFSPLLRFQIAPDGRR